jgi:predicted AlkP superfamily phosphohydrolase/phosphomutase
MPPGRVLAIGLDGYEVSIGDRMIEAGELPALARLKGASARFLLDHGPAQRTGLAWEHVSSGLAPERAGRWAAVGFDTTRYTVWQEGTSMPPFAADLPVRTVVFDTPYFDLERAPRVRGVVGWGAHDPGVALSARPPELLAEFRTRFGEYPAAELIYASPWPSEEGSRRMGRGLAQATDLRTRAACWLLKERLPDWDLALVVVSEPHSAIEGLCHGIDATHPLHGLPSARAAAEGMRDVYLAVDRLVGTLAEALPAATVVVFSMGGMGPNRSDVASMALLPELLFRHAFGRPLLTPRPSWAAAPNGVPLLDADEDWHAAVHGLIPRHEAPPSRLRRVLGPFIPSPVRRGLRALARARTAAAPVAPPGEGPLSLPLGWMPATRYQPYWRGMSGFALPSFYDGRIRVNLAGRESAGRVAPSRYGAVCDELEALVRECRDTASGEGVVDFVERPAGARDPRTMGPTESDLVVVWRGPLGLEHPRLGRIGPLPYRRTGGHTGRYGVAYVQGPGITPGDRAVRSSFDVVPTLIELVGQPVPPRLSGASLLTR